jgi:hypothetical protein
VNEDEARAALKAQGRDDTPQAVADLISEDPSASVEQGPSEGDDVSAHDGGAGTPPSPSEEAPIEPQGPPDSPPEPPVAPEAPQAPTPTPEEIQAAATLMRAAGYSVSPTPEAI